MDTQELYEFADREIRIGTHDRLIMAQAKEASGGVDAVTRQKYWQLRADAIRTKAKENPGVPDDLYFRELVARMNREEGGRRLRANLVGWMWVLVCFGSFCAAAIFFWAARSSFIHSRDSVYTFGGAGVGFLVLAIIAYVVTKRDAGEDPFAD
ncbi:hypothetical protein [Actomonas aquatica]|uniref:DUF2335 domain-containing protein n=1 Tax=Actomonas aquatica TaxID=2866162 RepID=A0ABZ1C2P3_9BACT|nr:hypothetical protein [Opitutus sp. WL0086]WRQ85978.1 hypothetical protein K1X11_014285 [Opitutus sp. WL0086]